MPTVRTTPSASPGLPGRRTPQARDDGGTRRPRRRLLVALSATATLALGSFALASPASAATAAPSVGAPADGGPIGGLLGGVSKVLGDVTKAPAKAPAKTPAKTPAKAPSTAPAKVRAKVEAHAPAPRAVAGAVSRAVRDVVAPVRAAASGASSGSTTGSSRAKDHASGSVAQVGGHRLPLVTVSGGGSQADRDRASAQAKLLAIGSYTLIGSQADSDGDGTGHGPVPDNGLCEASGGRLCLDLLYADSTAASANGASDAGTRTGVAGLCLGGHDASGTTCDGLDLGVARSESGVHTTPGGTKDSTASGSLADFCAEQAGSCLLAGALLGSDSASGTDAGDPQAPTLASLLVGDLALDGPDDPISTEVTKGCDTEVLCSTLNDKTTRPGSDDSGSAADLTGLGDTLAAGVGNSDTGSSATDPTTPTTPAPGTGGGRQGGSAHGALADLGLGTGDDEQPLLGLSDNTSTGDLSETRGDATLLSLFGQDVIASHADSTGDGEGHGPVPDNPLCASSGGALCIDPLYADSSAAQGDGSSSASTRTGIAAVCVGGHDATGKECDGLEVGVGQGASSLTNDGTSGTTTSTTSTSLAELCLHGDDACTVSGDALASQATADSTGRHSQDSSILDLGADGQQVGAPSDPIDLSVPGECTGDNLACLFLNQVGAGAEPGATSAGATVVGITGVGDTVGATAGRTEVSATGGEPTVVQPPGTNPPAVDPPGTDTPVVDAPIVKGSGSTTAGASAKGVASGPASAAAANTPTGVLPNTGGVPEGVVGVGLLLVAAGGATALIGRRRRVTR